MNTPSTVSQRSRRRKNRCNSAAGVVLCLLFSITLDTRLLAADSAQGSKGEEIKAAEIKVEWDQVAKISNTTPTLQVVVNPPLRRGSAIHDEAFRALRDLQADYVRFVPWLPYPRLGVAELEPPSADKTFWDFSQIDPVTLDFLAATEGHSVVLNFSTIPQWMFKTDKPVTYPSAPDEVFWGYEQGTELRDPSMKEVSDYFARLVSWYTLGGFTDELGRRHDSGHHFKIAYWEVLNEPEYEHAITPQTYTRIYDAVVSPLHKLNPQMKFVGMSLATPSKSPEFFEYFLDPKNHQPGIPLDAISYHFYAVPAPDQSSDMDPFTFFEQADHFLDTVRYVESIRRRLSPNTQTMLNEIGTIRAADISQGDGVAGGAIPPSYWNLSGGVYAYLYAQAAQLGVDVVGESQLVGYPTQFPSVSMLDWNTGRPNARYLVLQMLHDQFHPGDRLLQTKFDSPGLFAQGFVTAQGAKRVLLVNKRNRIARLSLPGAAGGRIQVVDRTAGGSSPQSRELSSNEFTLTGLAVAVVTFPNKNTK